MPTIAEAATIAAVTKAPTYYSPIANPENNIERRNDILYFMLQKARLNVRYRKSRSKVQSGADTWSVRQKKKKTKHSKVLLILLLSDEKF